VVAASGAVACERCVVASSAWLRLRGLLGRREMPAHEGVLLRPAGSIHMWFMRFAIDAVFVDRDGVVIDIAPGLKPWRMAARRGARAVLEVAAGECARRGLRVGDRLVLEPPSPLGGPVDA
jgi:hypothetical protein